MHTTLDALLSSYELLDHLEPRLAALGLRRSHVTSGVHGRFQIRHQALGVKS